MAAISSIFFGKLVAKIQSYGVALISFIAIEPWHVRAITSYFVQLCYSRSRPNGSLYGIVMPNFMTKGMELVPSNKRGLASGVLTSSIFIGQFASPFFSSALIAKLGYSDFYLLAGAFTLVLALAGTTTLKKQSALITNLK